MSTGAVNIKISREIALGKACDELSEYRTFKFISILLLLKIICAAVHTPKNKQRNKIPPLI